MATGRAFSQAACRVVSGLAAVNALILSASDLPSAERRANCSNSSRCGAQKPLALRGERSVTVHTSSAFLSCRIARPAGSFAVSGLRWWQR